MDSLSVAAGVVVLVTVLSYIVDRIQLRRIERLHFQLVGGIARDLNRVVQTIALYSGHGLPSADPEAAPGEESPVEAAVRKQMIWRTARQGGRK
jgi:hypothetical protein